jgi:tetratricopeptide (TPR) repeat protein
MKLLPCFSFLLVVSQLPALSAADEPPARHATKTPDESETLAERTLRDIVVRERELFAKARKAGDQFDQGVFHGEAQSIASSYDVLVQKNPELVAAYVAYGLFLGKVGMDKQAVAMLLKANKLDPNIALVKNQLAKHIAEDGKPVEALSYLMAAIQLDPRESLYHFHLGQLLLAGRDDFLTNGAFTQTGLDKAMLGAFKQAAELALTDFSYAYQYAKAYYEIDPPRWEEALGVWEELELRPITTTTLRHMVRLQKANVLIKLGRKEEARTVLETVTDPKLAEDKQTLLDQLAPKAEK